MSRRLIGPVDTIWLNMDRPNNLMVIESLMFLHGEVDWDRLLAGARERLLDRYPVFTQRPVMPRSPVGLPHWEDDPDFDLANHVRRVRLPRGDDAALQDYVGEQVSRPLDRSRPLWELHLVDGYDGGPVMFSRLHHSLADGIALARVLLSMTDASAEGGEDTGETWTEEEVHVPEELGLVDGAVQVAESAAAAARAAAAYGVGMVRQLPRLLRPRILSDAFTQTEKTVAVADKLLLTGRPHAPYSGTPGVPKRVAWCPPFPLDDVKRVGRAAGATVNDVLMGALAGALAAYTRERGAEPEDVFTMVPVNVRRLDRPLPAQLGNQFALVLLELPVSVEGPFARIAEAKRRMDVIKYSPEVVLTFGLIRAIGRTGPSLERYFVNFFAAKAIGVTTNVPGPRAHRYLAGARIDRILAWAPESGDQTLGLCVFTYAGAVHVGFKADAGLVPDPERLVEAFEAEITALRGFAHAV